MKPLLLWLLYTSLWFLCMYKSLFPWMALGTVSIGCRFCVDSCCTKTVAPHETETNVPWTFFFFFLKVCPVWLTNWANSHEAIKALCILRHLRLNKESQHYVFVFFLVVRRWPCLWRELCSQPSSCSCRVSQLDSCYSPRLLIKGMEMHHDRTRLSRDTHTQPQNIKDLSRKTVICLRREMLKGFQKLLKKEYCWESC